jgi:hypothetical protein
MENTGSAGFQAGSAGIQIPAQLVLALVHLSIQVCVQFFENQLSQFWTSSAGFGSSPATYSAGH